MVIFGFVVVMIAGSETGLAAALAVTGAGILAIEISGLAFGGRYGTRPGQGRRDAGWPSTRERLSDAGRANDAA